MLSIDEAIEELKSENGYYANNGMTDVAEFNTKIIRLLEELKAYIEIGTVEECRNSVLDIPKAYNKAIDDFVNFINTMPTVEEEDGTIRPMWLEEMAEQLKASEKNE